MSLLIWTSCGDGPKLRVVAATPEGCAAVQREDREKEWQEPVNVGATEMESSKKKDLGQMDSSWTWASNVFFLVLKSWNGILSCTKRSVVSRLLEIILTLSSALVRSHLTCSVQSGLLSKKDTWIYHTEFNKLSQRRDCSNSLIWKGWEAWDFLGWGRESTQDRGIWKESVKKTEPNYFH